MSGRRLGGHLVAEALEACGVRHAFGVPGVHALALFEALRTSGLRTIGGRTELAAAFSADGSARRTGEPTALLLSTGPGTLMALGGVLESASAHTPVVVISSQTRLADIGRRRGALHEIEDQLASVRPLVKWARRAVAVEQLADLVAEAVEAATRPPSGPVYLELPVDVLEAETDLRCPSLVAHQRRAAPEPARLERVAHLLGAARRPVLWAGGGVVRSGAWLQLTALAERLGAPVVTTYMGKGSIDERHELFAGSACEERAVLALLEEADVLLAAGTEMGAETTGQWQARFGGELIQLDASPDRIGATFPATPLIGDARAVLGALAESVPGEPRVDGAARAGRTRLEVAARLASGDRAALALLDELRAAVAWDHATVWDMTILGYWAASAFPVGAGRTFLYPLGSGTLGYALPAALGAAAHDAPVLAVSGDGGAMYGVSELVALAQHALPVTWLIVDDGGYGVLRHYQEQTYAEPYAVDLVRPGFAELAASCGVPARQVEPEGLGEHVREAMAAGGPQVLVLETRLAPPPGLS